MFVLKRLSGGGFGGYRWIKRESGKEYDLVEIPGWKALFELESAYVSSFGQACCEELAPLLKEHNDSCGEFFNFSKTVDSKEIVKKFSRKLAGKTKEYIYDENLFNACYKELEDDLYLNAFSCRILFPVRSGVFSDEINIDSVIHLENYFRIDRLSEDDVNDCMERDMRLGSRLGNTLYNISKFGVIYERTLKKDELLSLEKVINNGKTFYYPPMVDIFEVVNAMVLFKPCNVENHGYIVTSNHMLMSSEGMDYSGSVHYGSGRKALVLDESECKSFEMFYSVFSRIKSETEINAVFSINRFCISESRQVPEDKIVDIILALEALFLQSEQELALRLSLGVALFLGSSPEDKQVIYDNVKKSYNFRSSIVHGNSNYRKNMKDLNNLVEKLGEYTREILKKIVLEFSNKSHDEYREWIKKNFRQYINNLF